MSNECHSSSTTRFGSLFSAAKNRDSPMVPITRGKWFSAQNDLQRYCPRASHEVEAGSRKNDNRPTALLLGNNQQSPPSNGTSRFPGVSHEVEEHATTAQTEGEKAHWTFGWGAKMASANPASATEMASDDPASATTEEQIEDIHSDYDDPSPNHSQKKKGNEYIKTLFSIENGTKEDGKPMYQITCSLCNKLFTWQAINATKLTQHILRSCRNATNEIKEKALSQTQHKKREKEAMLFLSTSPDGTYTNETTEHIKQAALSKNKTTQSSAKKQKVVQSTMLRSYCSYKAVDYQNAIMLQLEVMLQRFEPISRLHDCAVKNSLVQIYGNGILKHIPETIDTIFNNYIVDIDLKTRKALMEQIQRTAGTMAMEVDGVTVNKTSLLLYTLSKGDFSVFTDITRLRELVHVRASEVEDGVQKMEKLVKEYKTPITNLAVDNAATKVMEEVIAEYAKRNPEEPPVMSTRDPSHCLDLIGKDSTKVACFQKLYSETMDLYDFLTTDRVSGIVDALFDDGRMTRFAKPTKHSETRFNRSAETFRTMLKQKPFLDLISSDGVEEFTRYYDSRTVARKKKIDEQLLIADPKYWRRVKISIKWFSSLEHAQKLTSGNNFPQACYLPLVQALRNELNEILKESEEINRLFGENSAQDLANFVRVRFNMDGKNPTGAKVGLLSRFQIWAYIVDPFTRSLKTPVSIEPTVSGQVVEMLNFFVPTKDQMDEETKRAQTDLRMTTSREFNEYYGRQGVWKNVFHEPSEELPDPDLIRKQQKSLRLKDVSKWVVETDGVKGRLDFFCTVSHYNIYRKVAKPLLSARTSGSIAVERVAKPLKKRVLGRDRASLGIENAAICLRAGLNLRFLASARGELRLGANTAREASINAMKDLINDYEDTTENANAVADENERD